MVSAPVVEKSINKIKRFSVVCFVKKYYIPFIVIGLFILSLLLGFWNIRVIDYSNSDLKYVDKGKLEEGFNNIYGNNIFSLKPNDVVFELKNSSGFIKSVYVDKVIPSKLVLEIQEYEPKYVFYFSNSCNLYSSDGERLMSLCEDCVSECKQMSLDWDVIYITSSDLLDEGERFIYYSEIADILTLLSEFGYDIYDISIEKGVVVLSNEQHFFVFDITRDLEVQLSRFYLVGEKINHDNVEFKSLDLRFERPVLKINN